MDAVRALPEGLQAVVVKYGQNQKDAIENSIVLQPQQPPSSKDLIDGDIIVAVMATEIVWTDTVMVRFCLFRFSYSLFSLIHFLRLLVNINTKQKYRIHLE